MDKRMLKCRQISQTANKLADLLNGEMLEETQTLLRDMSVQYENEYNHFKQVEKEPTVVYQMFGKKTSELTEEEFREYKAFLKRVRDKQKFEKKLSEIH